MKGAVEGIARKPKHEQSNVVSMGFSGGEETQPRRHPVEPPENIGGPGRTITTRDFKGLHWRPALTHHCAA